MSFVLTNEVSKPSSFSHAPLNSRLPALTPRKASYRTSQHRGRETSEDEGRAGKAGASEEASEEEHQEEEEEAEEEGSMDADQTGEFLNKLRFDDSHRHPQGPSKPKNQHLNKHKENLKQILQDSSSNVSLQDGSGLDYQELVIIEDLFFILLGIEGTFIEYHEHFSPDDPFERLQGARFSIDNDLGRPSSLPSPLFL
jgi:gamma-tubulin complex component 2